MYSPNTVGPTYNLPVGLLIIIYYCRYNKIL